MPDDQQCPQTEWLADLKNLISSAEDKAGGGGGAGEERREKKKGVCPKNAQINAPLYSVHLVHARDYFYLSLPIQAITSIKQRKN